MNDETSGDAAPVDAVKVTNDARHAAFTAMSKVHAWHWVRVGASKEADDVLAALERLKTRLDAGDGPKEAEGLRWDNVAKQWVKTDNGPGPAIRPRTTAA